MEVEAHVEQEA
jgi:hypothetical protein